VREIPEEITVRLENMAGDTLTIGDLEIPGGVTPTAESSERVCQIVVQDDTEAEETGEAGGEAAAEGEAPAETTEEAGDS
ncbi:MAG: 50S ribosomal protein L25, partial [Planctomycetota bacterium]|nr:50S ribosomal protein L25 [Planctomycetota bacterium]